MKKGRFIDYKVTRWERIHVPDALTDEQMIAILDKNVEIDMVIEDIMEATKESPLIQNVPDTVEFMHVQENDGQETMGLHDGNGVTLWSNEHTKEVIIGKIRAILSEHGDVSTAELQLDSSVVYQSNGKDNFSLIEQYRYADVGVVAYVHETVTDEFDVDYGELSIDQLDEILEHLEGYKLDMDKTMERTKD